MRIHTPKPPEVTPPPPPPNFMGGDFSSDLQSRVDLEKYSVGVQRHDNFFPAHTPRGHRQMKRAGNRLAYGKPLRRYYLAQVIAAAAFAALLVFGLLYGMEKEDEARDVIRAERCAKWGENLPKQLEKYCDNLGN